MLVMSLLDNEIKRKGQGRLRCSLDGLAGLNFTSLQYHMLEANFHQVQPAEHTRRQ